MFSRRSIGLVAIAGGAAAFAIPTLAERQPDSGPVARYDMRAGTVSGTGAAGAQISPMSMMMGGDSKVQHELLLRLGSDTVAADSKPKANHFMPSGAKLGKSVALVTPKTERSPEEADQLPGEPGQKPKGRILIYWGCGEHAPAGQPVVIDLARLQAGQVPPDLFTATVIRDWGPTLTNSRTYGRWPAEDGKYVKPDSSLLGAHRIAGNYSPEIAFTLSKDFMAPLVTTLLPRNSGASTLGWGAVPNATGYFAYIMGGKQDANGDMGDMVMWSSSSTRQFGGGLTDWISPGQVAGLVRNQTVMAPDRTECIIPVEVNRDAPDFQMGSLIAFGPEENFAYPPRPDDAKVRWDLQWTARVRHRSLTGWMKAQGMVMGIDDGTQPKPECKPKRGLGGVLGGALGGTLGGAIGDAVDPAKGC